jgi:hypothetical protein
MISEAMSASIIRNDTLKMEAEKASETLYCCSLLTRLVAREDFIAFNRGESFKSHIKIDINET